MAQSRSDFTKNQLLNALSIEQYQKLSPKLEPVTLTFKQILYVPEQPIQYVYFVNDGMVSLVNVTEDGATVEAATVGNEGMVGISVLLGVDRTLTQAIVQIAGHALRMPVETFKREVTPDTPLYPLLLRYTQALINQLSQTVACNRLHSVEERCCRWLLMCQDRTGTDQFLLTQELLSQMLGVRRASVSVVASILQKAGLIRYSRGRITILNRSGLEAASCECYRVVKTEFQRLLECDLEVNN
jgi:CRP-like cAMP-binding protein